jgi:hypothetical protein
MDQSNIKKPGQLGSGPPPAGPPVEPDLPPPLRQDLRVDRKHDGWLAFVALLYPAVSFPLLIRNPLDVSIFLVTVALGVVLVAVVLYLWDLKVLSSGWEVAAFMVWMLGLVVGILAGAGSWPDPG